MSTKIIEIQAYDPLWAEIFLDIKMILARSLGELVIQIEHVGSTAVPGLAAKAILDIDVVIDSRERLPAIIEKLVPLGYYHNGDQGIPNREAFKRKDEFVPYTSSKRRWMKQHLYVCPKDSKELARHIFFRDFLLKHPEAVKSYATLKRQLAEKYRTEPLWYSEAKTEFIEKIVAQM